MYLGSEGDCQSFNTLDFRMENTVCMYVLIYKMVGVKVF